MTKSMMTNKCTSFAGNFDGRVGAWVQCHVHHLMQHVQSYTQCLRMPPSGHYFLRIASVAARVPCKMTMIKNTPTLLAILMAMAMRQYNTVHIAQWRRFRASLEATGCCHRASVWSDSINWSCQHCFFLVFPWSIFWKRAQGQMMVSNNNKGTTHRNDEKHWGKMIGYFVGVVKLSFLVSAIGLYYTLFK